MRSLQLSTLAALVLILPGCSLGGLQVLSEGTWFPLPSAPAATTAESTEGDAMTPAEYAADLLEALEIAGKFMTVGPVVYLIDAIYPLGLWDEPAPDPDPPITPALESEAPADEEALDHKDGNAPTAATSGESVALSEIPGAEPPER